MLLPLDMAAQTHLVPANMLIAELAHLHFSLQTLIILVIWGGLIQF